MIVIYLEEKARFALRFSRNGQSGRTDKFLRRKFLRDFKINKNERKKMLIENFLSKTMTLRLLKRYFYSRKIEDSNFLSSTVLERFEILISY